MSLPSSSPSNQQSKRLFQLGFAPRRAYLKKTMRRAVRSDSSLQRVSQPRSHQLWQLALCRLQQLSRRRLIWDNQRECEYDQRNVAMSRHDERIRSADQCDVVALKEKKQADFDSRMVVIQRFNFGPAGVVGGGALVDSRMQHFVQVASLGVLESDGVSALSPELSGVALSERQRQVKLAVVMADVPWPSSATIRSTPRRPGAPFAVLPH